MLKSKLKGMTGHLSIALNGEVVAEVPNIVTTVGINFVASRIEGVDDAVMSHMAIGTGTTAVSASDTTLETEAARVALTSTTATNEDVVFVATFPAGTGTGAITEAGILNDASTGTLLCHTVFSVVNKGADDAMTITWTVTVS